MKKLLSLLLDIFFPKKCVLCGKFDFMLCPKCRSSIVFLEKQRCPFCNRLTITGRTCPTCRKTRKLKGVKVVAIYQEPLKAAIHEFKYNGLKSFSKELADITWPYLEDISKGATLTFVPIGPKRLRQRGYNQSELLAGDLAAETGRSLEKSFLVKIKETKSQIELKRKDRLKNLDGSFALGSANPKGKKIIIIDDILTTGTTLEQCAKVLYKAGAKEVWGFVLAKNL